jgi:hypothetical protein
MNRKDAPADYIAAEEFPTLFKAPTVEGGYTVKQVFNLSEEACSEAYT